MIPPPPPSGKPFAFYDTECFSNYWLLKIRPQSGPVFAFRLRAGESFDRTTAEKIDFLFSIFTVVSFNGIYYDAPVIGAALHGFNCEQLKWLSDQIIIEERKPWELGPGFEWRPPDHIDIMETLPGAGSLKQYAGRIHSKRMQDLPYEPNAFLTEDQIVKVDDYCGNDLDTLEDCFKALEPSLRLRTYLGKRFGIDLRSKSDAQVGETIIKVQCEKILGQKIYKPEIDWNLRFRYEPPAFLAFEHPQLAAAFETIKSAIFTLGGSCRVEMPPELEDLEIPIGRTTYRLGIGGLHSKDVRAVFKSDETDVILSPDVASYYPSLIINSGKYPAALGPTMQPVYAERKAERLEAKGLEKKLKKAGDTKSPQAVQAHYDNEGGKVILNGPFGKLNSPYSILFAPEMFIQTTIGGQLCLLMLIDWLENRGIPVISANTDGIVILCPRHLRELCESIIKVWEQRTGLDMDISEYKAIYCRDVNCYFAITSAGEVKRKGEYAKAGLVEKKNPDVEICGDAVADLLSKGIPILHTLATCRDIRKFITMQKVTGGAVKLWGPGPSKEMKVVNMTSKLVASGWALVPGRGRKWTKDGIVTDARTAYGKCFPPQRPEFLGKVVRWYYSTAAPGSIIYNTNGNLVGNSYGAHPCMELPDNFPSNVDYDWYLANCEKMLRDVGYYASL